MALASDLHFVVAFDQDRGGQTGQRAGLESAQTRLGQDVISLFSGSSVLVDASVLLMT
jgi:hypothetical protein